MAPVSEVPGNVVSLNDARVATEIEGVLTWIADVGAAVEAGDVIARIDPRLPRIAVVRAKASVARLEADLRYREQQLKRAEELARSNNVSATLLDESRAERDRALNELVDARAELEQATGDLERTQVRAAFAGHVVERLASVGEYLAVGEVVIRIVDTHRKEITLPAPISLAAFLDPGLEVRARNAGVERLHKVRTVVPVGDAVSRMVEVRLEASDSDWLVGSPVQVSLPAGRPQNATAVPRDALVQRGGQSFVYRVTDDGAAEQVAVEVHQTVGLWVATGDNIRAGDRVVIRGAERLMPGQPVEVLATD
jgi:RND family efflux transporter MFP subunit